MPSPRLEVNFFVVALPDKPLPFFVRKLGEGETLRDPEYGWKIDVPQPVSQNKAVLVRERRPQDVDYETEEHPPAIVAPGIVKRLLEFGLAASFEKRGRIVVKHKLSFACYDPKEVIKSSLPDFLLVRRGVEFWIDHLTHQGRRSYGFFVSATTSQQFQIGLNDPALARAAQGRTITCDDGRGSCPATLVRVDSRKKNAIVSHDEQEIELPLSQVTVPASREIVNAYCETTFQVNLIPKIRGALRAASFRYKPNGQRNTQWLRDEIQFLSGWLVLASHNGRVPMLWPNSSQQLSLNTQPSSAVETRRP